MTMWLAVLACSGTPSPEVQPEPADEPEAAPEKVAAGRAPAPPGLPLPHQRPELPPPPPVDQPERGPRPQLDNDDVMSLAFGLADPRTFGAAQYRLRAHPQDTALAAVKQAYVGSPEADRGGVAVELLARSPDDYRTMAAKAEQARWESKFETDARSVASSVGAHLVQWPVGRPLLARALEHADPEVRRRALATLEQFPQVMASDLVEPVAAQLRVPGHVGLAESVLERFADPVGLKRVDAHAHARHPLPVAAPVTPPPATLPPPVPVTLFSWGIEVHLDESMQLADYSTITVVSPRGVEHVPLALVREDCVGHCGEPMCERVLRYRRVRQGEEPVFVFPGTLPMSEVAPTEWVEAESEECSVARSGDFERISCGTSDLGNRTLQVKHKGDELFSTYEDYSSGGTGDLPLSVVYGARRFHLFRGIAKFRIVVGWADVDRAKPRTSIAERWFSTICDGMPEATRLRRKVFGLGSGGSWSSFWAVVRPPTGKVEVVRPRADNQALGEHLLFGYTQGFVEGPVFEATFGPECAPRSGWPAKVDAPCEARLGERTYTFERLAMTDNLVGLRVLRRTEWHVSYEDISVVTPEDADRYAVLFAGDLNQDGELDLLVGPSATYRRYFPSGYPPDLFENPYELH